MQRRQKQIQPTDLKLKAIGAVVREFRKRAGRSQERLSGECGFDRTYISRVERGSSTRPWGDCGRSQTRWRPR